MQQVNDISLLRAVKYLIRYGLKNEGHISIEQYDRELEEADVEIGRGEYITQDELKKTDEGMVEKAKPVIIWNNQASVYFKKVYNQIEEGSYQQRQTRTSPGRRRTHR